MILVGEKREITGVTVLNLLTPRGGGEIGKEGDESVATDKYRSPQFEP